MSILINLIGEQPIPNLIPILYYKPDKVINLYSDTTKIVERKLRELIPNCEPQEIDAYDFQNILNVIRNKISNEKGELIFNITGGTKIMSLALYEAAKDKIANFIYLQSEQNKTIIYNYFYQGESILKEKIIVPELINVDLYLKAHLFDYRIESESTTGSNFENAIATILKRNNFEVLQNIKPVGEGNQLEIDLVFRYKGTNNVAIAEIKIGDQKQEGPKKGIEQLALASQREYLGIYTKRFLITSRILSKQIKELALAHNLNIIDGIELERRNNNLTKQSEQKLVEYIKEKLL
ncbi:MAG: DUF1887 family CARF protein [Melioribacteraceae bacterium]